MAFLEVVLLRNLFDLWHPTPERHVMNLYQ
jgi:hypothetical protein